MSHADGLYGDDLEFMFSIQQFRFAVAVEAAAHTRGASTDISIRSREETSFGPLFAVIRLVKTRRKDHAREHYTDIVRDHRCRDDTFVR
jgi:hypothetical protein